jgi:ERI1 exoribonuclease 3
VRDYFRKYINIKKYFFKLVKVRERVNGMMDMLKVLGLKHEGKHHSGIDDVINICNICIELIAKHKATFPSSEVTTI